MDSGPSIIKVLKRFRFRTVLDLFVGRVKKAKLELRSTQNKEMIMCMSIMCMVQ